MPSSSTQGPSLVNDEQGVVTAMPVLATKLHPPRRRRGTLDRPRLAARPTEELPTLTLVSAPAGFGKSTLLAGWVASSSPEDRTAWLSLDSGDSDVAVFWTYLVAALQTVAVGVGDDALSLQRAARPLESAAASLLNDLTVFGEEVVVVLDDYHVIDAVDVHDTVSFLVEHAPANVHLVIAGRADPPLPLARLRARGDLLELRAADLRFTSEETGRYFAESIGLDLTAADVSALDSRTEGWVAALQLAALSMQGRDDPSAFIAAFAGDDRFVVDYLAEEVLERQPEEVRDFLLATSILDRFTSELCDAVTGGTDAKAMLDRLDRGNLFLVPLDDRRRWYRYHHLFADVLRARLLDQDPERIPALHRRACDWYQQAGDDAEAIAHAIAGYDFERAAQLVELAAPGLRQRRQEATLRRWLEALPNSIYEDRPVLAITLVGARMATGDTTHVERLLELVEATLLPSSPPAIVFDDGERAGLPAQVLIYRAALALLAGDIDATTRHATAALALIVPSDHLRRGSATALLGLARWAAGDLRTAEGHYAEAISALRSAGHLADSLGCTLALADIQIAQGRLTDAARTFDGGLLLTRDHPGLRGAADMHVGLSEVLIERNDLDAAASHLQTSAELGEPAGLPQHPYRWRVTMARLCRARGDLAGSLALIDEAAPLYDTDFSPPVRPVAAIRARVQLALGDLDAARAWVTERRLTVADDLSYLREYEHITLARVLISSQAAGHGDGGLDGALGLLERLHAAAEAGGRTGSVIEILILQAAAHHVRRDTPAAVAALAEALRHAEPEQHVRLFLHAGPGVTALLRTMADREPDGSYARRVLVAQSGPAASSGGPAERAVLVDELTSRELDVLRLLRSDLSGPDIARELVVSLNTVRTHTKSIYAKLGVSSRREAVTRAAELGL